MNLALKQTRKREALEAGGRRKWLVVATCFLLFMHLAETGRSASEYEYIDIDSPFLRKIPIAIPVFFPIQNSDATSPLLQNTTDLLTETLIFTGFFSLVDREAYLIDPQRPPIVVDDINFSNWKTVGAELLITGAMALDGNRISLELRLFDTLTGKRLIGKRYGGTVDDLRQIIRRFCSEIILQFTGHRGVFDSKIAFVSTGSGNKEIYISEFDGNAPEQLTRHGKISLFPAWSSDGDWIAYTTYVNDKPDIYIQDLTSNQKMVIDKKGINIAPAWRPGEFQLAATLSFSGNQEIYLLTGTGKIIKRITRNWASDVSPTWSPDGKKIAFVSNRSGSPQIFLKDIDSGQVERLTFEGSYNTQPNWSPAGGRIAFTSSVDGGNEIFVIDVANRETTRLTRNSGYNESPSWSPDGSLIVFSSTREGPSRIYVMTAYGTDQRRLLTLPGEQSNPRWSPNLSKN
jgi:TolB protein